MLPLDIDNLSSLNKFHHQICLDYSYTKTLSNAPKKKKLLPLITIENNNQICHKISYNNPIIPSKLQIDMYLSIKKLATMIYTRT